ncbi:hypothetical protein KGM_202334 [Danaus plexippus plexippus]|uniref:Uncharacterized protein n=1 Tax=Danaus plexippus plexippus TaxID=278856 RepID=A0A212FL21_DANPL|nr:hypothetical protein KGM_202334 [Danaus plexippus plexippus]
MEPKIMKATIKSYEIRSGGDERVPLVTQYQQDRTHVPAETENTVSLTVPSLPDTGPYDGKTRHAELLIERPRLSDTTAPVGQ